MARWDAFSVDRGEAPLRVAIEERVNRAEQRRHLATQRLDRRAGCPEDVLALRKIAQGNKELGTQRLHLVHAVRLIKQDDGLVPVLGAREGEEFLLRVVMHDVIGACAAQEVCPSGYASTAGAA